MIPKATNRSSIARRLFPVHSFLVVRRRRPLPENLPGEPSLQHVQTISDRSHLPLPPVLRRGHVLKFVLAVCILLNCAFCLLPTASAEDTVDSLKQALSVARTDSSRLHILFELINAMLLSENTGTLDYLKQAEALVNRSFGLKERAELCLRYGRYYSFAGNYEKAAQYYLKAMETAEKAGDAQVLEYAMNNFAVLNMQIKNYRKGIETFEKLLRMAREKGDSQAEIEFLLNLATAYGEYGDLARSEQYLKSVYTSPNAELFYRTVAANNLSFVCNRSGRYKEAERYAREAIRAWEKLHNVQLYLQSLTNLSNSLIGQKRFREAKPVTEKLISLAQTHHFKQEMVDGLGNLAAIYEGLGRYRSALRYQKEYAAKKDSLLIEENLRQINELQVKYETEKKEREIALRKRQLRTAKEWLRFLLAVIVLIAGFSTLLARLYLHKQRAYRELVRKNLELMNSEQIISNLEREIQKKDAVQPHSYSGVGNAEVPNERTKALLEELRAALYEKKVYLRSDLSIEKLAAEMNVSSRHLSQIIHAHYRTTFPKLINQLRISEARRMLVDEKFRHYSVEGIAQTVGFSSKSSFNVAFKKITGLTPSYFRDSVKNTGPSEES